MLCKIVLHASYYISSTYRVESLVLRETWVLCVVSASFYFYFFIIGSDSISKCPPTIFSSYRKWFGCYYTCWNFVLCRKMWKIGQLMSSQMHSLGSKTILDIIQNDFFFSIYAKGFFDKWYWLQYFGVLLTLIPNIYIYTFERTCNCLLKRQQSISLQSLPYQKLPNVIFACQ